MTKNTLYNKQQHSNFSTSMYQTQASRKLKKEVVVKCTCSTSAVTGVIPLSTVSEVIRGHTNTGLLLQHHSHHMSLLHTLLSLWWTSEMGCHSSGAVPPQLLWSPEPFLQPTFSCNLLTKLF